jgi:hypothetical protein
MSAQSPRAALDARLRALPAPDDEEFQPTTFFRRLLDADKRPMAAIGREALFADHQRLQQRLSDTLAEFLRHRACHGLEFTVVLATHGESAARGFLADVARWDAELNRLMAPETSAVSAFVRRGSR